jgi:hypothetical protein
MAFGHRSRRPLPLPPPSQALLFPNLLLLFYPVSRGSALLQAAGLSYPEAIRYHRWLGHWTMVGRRGGLLFVGEVYPCVWWGFCMYGGGFVCTGGALCA